LEMSVIDLQLFLCFIKPVLLKKIKNCVFL
jgi:hypothetical protein